jgi:two-component system sensor histidine kinase KdpD
VFLPFHWLGDPGDTVGVGLGLVVARGLTEAMGGTVEPEETAGGGLTMVVSLPAAPVWPAAEVAGARRMRAA